MHTSEMKKHGFINNKVLEHITKASVEKALLILNANVKWLSMESRGHLDHDEPRDSQPHV